MCTQGSFSMCFGGGLDVGAGFLEVEGDDAGEKIGAYMAGARVHQESGYYSFEAMNIKPVGLFGINLGNFYAQAEIGLEMYFPILNTEGKDSAEVGMAYGFGAGYKFFDMLVPIIEFKGIAGLTDEFDEFKPFWLNFGARLTLGGFEPYFRLSIPLNDDAKQNPLGLDDDTVHMDVGFAFKF
jgi:hypothetical protein